MGRATAPLGGCLRYAGRAAVTCNNWGGDLRCAGSAGAACDARPCQLAAEPQACAVSLQTRLKLRAKMDQVKME